MDFDDLLFRTVNLLELFEEVRGRYATPSATSWSTSTRTRTAPQYRMFRCCPSGAGRRASQPGRRRRRLTIDLQLPGRRLRNILDFQDDFPDARVVKLEQNYRSTQTILSAANAVIANNRGGMAKRLWSELGEGDPIQLRELDDEHAEAGSCRRDRAAPRRGRLALGDRRPLPHQRDVAGDRGYARARARSPTR